jgi:hypothetical protein
MGFLLYRFSSPWNYKEDMAAVKDREERLKQGEDGASLLLKMRTYHLKRAAGVEGVASCDFS